MASPQKEDGHVEIANEIIEILAMTYLSSYESQVLWAIFRKTYGWNKKEDWITNTQITKMTGIAESHVSRTIKKLIGRNIVSKNDKKLSFQKDYDKWQKLPKQVSKKKIPKQDSNIPKQVSEVTQTGIKKLPKQVDTKDTKDTTTKNTITKDKDVFIEAWNNYKIMRKKIKKPMTEKAEELIKSKLNKLSNNKYEQIEILNQSIMNSWQEIYELKKRGGYNGKNKGYNKPDTSGSKGSGFDKYKQLEETYEV